jgi:hypothetical protein
MQARPIDLVRVVDNSASDVKVGTVYTSIWNSLFLARNLVFITNIVEIIAFSAGHFPLRVQVFDTAEFESSENS